MDFKPITLEHKELFKSYLAGRYYRLITYNFSTLYLWRNWDPYAWDVVEGALVVTSNYLGLDTVLCPISPKDEQVFAATEALISWYAQEGREFIISEVDGDMLERFSQRWPGRFRAEEYPPGANYIYRQQDLALLAGKGYDGKRNHLRRFIRAYPDYQFVPLSKENAPACQESLRLWYERRDMEDEELRLEYAGCQDALANFRHLDFRGAVLMAGGRVMAFTMGEPLNSDTFCVHIEKADSGITGAYQAINSFYARDYCQGYLYVNRAEDMGQPGLRRAKESYHPCSMEKKYYLRLI